MESSNPRDVLAEMVALRELPPSPELEDSPTPAAAADPEEPLAPTPADEPGEEISPSEETPVAEGEDPAATGDEQDQNSQTVDAELTAAVAKLSPTERKAVLELAQTLQPGEIPRIAKLVSQKYQAEETIEKLTAELETARAERDSGAATAVPITAAMPEAVAKLKTVAEVQSRLDVAQSQAEAIQDFLDANPGDANAEYQIGDKTFTRAQLIQQRATIRTELKALPQRGQQITAQAESAQRRTAAKQHLVTALPWVKDPANPRTVKIQAALKANPWMQSFDNPEWMAAQMVFGYDNLATEINARTKGKPAAPAARPLGSKVPLKPAVNGNGVRPKAGLQPAPTATGEAAKAALDGIGKIGSRESLAKLLEATGR